MEENYKELIEEVLRKEVLNVEGKTKSKYKVLIGSDEEEDVFMCINYKDYFEADKYRPDVPFEIKWRSAVEVKKDLDKIKKEIEGKKTEHKEMYEELIKEL